jgi:pimeloyl-ACP methyl ester carboxylesterase
MFVTELTSTTGFLDAQGAPLYYEVAGQGPALLLIHAGIADQRMWDQQFAVFAQRYTVIRYDQHSYGKSLVPAGPFAYYEDPAVLLRLLGLPKAHVIGASFGGKVALDFTLAHPEMVESLLLAAPDVGGSAVPENVRRFGEEEEALLERGDLAAATELNMRMWVDGPQRTPEQVNPHVRQQVYTMQYQAFSASVPEGASVIHLDPPAIERLAEVHVPTMVLVGELDHPEWSARAGELTTHIAGAKEITIPGGGHLLSMDQPELFTRTVLDFLSTIE